MITISLNCVEEKLDFTNIPDIFSGDINSVKLAIAFNSSWDGYGRTAVFYDTTGAPIFKVLDINNECIVPVEVLTKDGKVHIGVIGSNGSEVLTSEIVCFKIGKGATTLSIVDEPTPDVWEQILASYGEIVDLVNNLEAELAAKGVTVRYNSENDMIQIQDESGAWHDWASADIENHCIIKNGNPFVDYETNSEIGSTQLSDGYFIVSTAVGGSIRFSTDMTVYPGKFLKIVAHIDEENTNDYSNLSIESTSTSYGVVDYKEVASLILDKSEKTFFIPLDNFKNNYKYLTLKFTNNQYLFYIKTISITSENGTEGAGEYDSSVELTQKEYDALPDTKLTDNKNYFIKDGKGGGGSGSGYSETLLFNNTDKVTSGTITLSDSILNYKQIMFEVTNTNEANWEVTSFSPYLVSAISDRIGGQSENKAIFVNGVAGAWHSLFITSENSLTFGEGSSLLIKRIYGIKY